MRAIRRCLVGLALSALLVSSAAGRDIFVDNLAGDDTFTGHHPGTMPDRSGPTRSIAKALWMAQQGDRIVLRNNGQPYRESLSLVGSRHSGYSFSRLTILGNGAILDGSAIVQPEEWENYRGPVFRFRPPHLAYQQLFINDRPVPRLIPAPLADQPPKLEPLQWCLHGGYIYFCVEPLKLPENYRLTYAAQRVGITLFHVERVCISDLTVQGFQLDGINLYNSAQDVMLERVTCRGNGRCGLTVGGASLAHVGSSLFGNNGIEQVLVMPWSELHLRQTELLSNTGPGLVNQGRRVYLDGKPVAGGIDESPKDSPKEPPQAAGK
jgi:hypothetical protein